MAQPYHKYVFDTSNRVFIGNFEEMYRSEETEKYDSWFQEDLTDLNKQLSLAVLGRYNFGSILDVGCGKGAFTHLLKKSNNSVRGIDFSETAITKAKARFPGVEFEVMDVTQLWSITEKRFELVVMMEILSYIENWKTLIKRFSGIADFCYITLYVPPDPIGFVGSVGELLHEVAKWFDIETEMVLNGDHILLLARAKTLAV